MSNGVNKNKTDIIIERCNKAERKVRMFNFLNKTSHAIAVFAIICAMFSIWSFGAQRTILGICLIVAYVVLNIVWFALTYVFVPNFNGAGKKR